MIHKPIVIEITENLKNMKKLVFTLGAIALIVFMGSCSGKPKEQAKEQKIFATADELVADAKTRIKEISIEDFRAQYDGEDAFVLIDVRTVKEHNAGFIPSSISIPRGVLEFRILSEKVWDDEGMYVPKKEEAIFIYCKKGHRGTLAAESLEKMGYSNVTNIQSGFSGWKAKYAEDIEKIESAGGFEAAAEEEDAGGC